MKLGRHARSLMLGLLAGLPGPHCWTSIKHAGHRSRDALQMLADAVWDDDGVRDDLHCYVVKHLRELISAECLTNVTEVVARGYLYLAAAVV